MFGTTGQAGILRHAEFIRCLASLAQKPPQKTEQDLWRTPILSQFGEPQQIAQPVGIHVRNGPANLLLVAPTLSDDLRKVFRDIDKSTGSPTSATHGVERSGVTRYHRQRHLTLGNDAALESARSNGALPPCAHAALDKAGPPRRSSPQVQQRAQRRLPQHQVERPLLLPQKLSLPRALLPAAPHPIRAPIRPSAAYRTKQNAETLGATAAARNLSRRSARPTPTNEGSRGICQMRGRRRPF